MKEAQTQHSLWPALSGTGGWTPHEEVHSSPRKPHHVCWVFLAWMLSSFQRALKKTNKQVKGTVVAHTITNCHFKHQSSPLSPERKLSHEKLRKGQQEICFPQHRSDEVIGAFTGSLTSSGEQVSVSTGKGTCNIPFHTVKSQTTWYWDSAENLSLLPTCNASFSGLMGLPFHMMDQKMAFFKFWEK